MGSRSYMLTVVAVLFTGRFQKWESRATTTTESRFGSGEVCNTQECISIAAKMLEKMNRSADPCQDFSEFACGRYMREAQIPAGKALVSTMEDLKEQNKLTLHDILNSTSSGRPGYMDKILVFYRSCMNEDAIEAAGVAPYFNDTTFVNDWPTLNPQWNDSNFELSRVISRYLRTLVNPLISIDVHPEMLNTSNYLLYVMDGALGINDADLRADRNSSKIRAYEKYLTEFAVALNVTRALAEQDARAVVDLEITLAKIRVQGGARDDLFSMYNLLTSQQLLQLYPALNIPLIIRETLAMVNSSLGDDQKVVITFPQYMKDIESVLQCFSKRTIQNMFGFKYALIRLESLTQRLRQIRQEFDAVYLGTQNIMPRWKECVDLTLLVFWQGTSKEFVNRVISAEAKAYALQMITEFKAEFTQMIGNVTWMSNASKEEAYTKLAAMRVKVGYPDVNFDEEYIERIHENLNLRELDFYHNRYLGKLVERLFNLDAYTRPVDRNRWRLPPADVEAYAFLMGNEIAFLGGLLQPPYFSMSFPDYLNYGGFGFAVGHELTHNFDTTGMHFDKDGNVRAWWTDEESASVANISSCFIDQYSSFTVSEINASVNAINTLNENQADSGGVKESFRAYKQHVLTYGLHPRLPTLNLTQDQLFFLSSAQVHCDKMTPEKMAHHLNDFHSPGKFRIIGAMQNSEDFSRTFNCPLQSYMNPERKCAMW